MISEKLTDTVVYGPVEELILSDFERVVERKSLEFAGDGKGVFKRLVSKMLGSILKTKPVLKKDMCVGCGICAGICPAKAIKIVKKKAIIDRKACIRCFCCQEFCPKSAMKVHRTPIAKLFVGGK